MRAMKMRNLLLYYLLHAIKELGIPLPLLYRRIAEVAKRDLKYISHTFCSDKLKMDSLENLAKDLADMLIREQIAEKINLEFKDDQIVVEVYNCCYLSMAELGKERGDKSCPICLVSLVATIAETFIKGITFNKIEYETDFSNRKCIIHAYHVKE